MDKSSLQLLKGRINSTQTTGSEVNVVFRRPQHPAQRVCMDTHSSRVVDTEASSRVAIGNFKAQFENSQFFADSEPNLAKKLAKNIHNTSATPEISMLSQRRDVATAIDADHHEIDHIRLEPAKMTSYLQREHKLQVTTPCEMVKTGDGEAVAKVAPLEISKAVASKYSIIWKCKDCDIECIPVRRER